MARANAQKRTSRDGVAVGSLAKWSAAQPIIRWLLLALSALMLTGTALVPVDSIELEQGVGLILLPLAVVVWGLASSYSPSTVGSEVGGDAQATGKGSGRFLNAGVIALVFWIVCSALAVAGDGNLRTAVNEMWWWITGGLWFIAVRRMSRELAIARGLVTVIVALVVGQAGFGLHQQLISLPADVARLEADPEGTMRAAGLRGEVGSPEWELFRARLVDAAPMGTFPLSNSLAGVLVVGWCLGLLWMIAAWRAGKRWVTVLPIGGFVLLPIALVLYWTDSRGGIVAAVVGTCATILAWWLLRSDDAEEVLSSQRIWQAARYVGGLGLVAMVVGCMSLAMAPALWSYAPRTIEFRFEYWRGTLAMVAAHPLFGAGPGNFRETYLAHRLDTASEGIADPHNWFMETLAAGGIPAMVLWCVVIVLGIVVATRVPSGWQVVGSDAIVPAKGGKGAIAVGTVLALLVAIAYWLRIGSLPFDPLMVATIMVTGVLASAVHSGQVLGVNALRWGALSASGALGVHWLIAGGWTVPGMAIPWLTLAGVATADIGACSPVLCEAFGRPVNEATWWERPGVRWVLGGLLLVAWYVTAWGPTSKSSVALMAGELAWARGDLRSAEEVERSLAAAAAADPWDPLPVMRLTEVRMWRVVASDSPASRESWQAAMEAAVERDGRSSQVRAQIASEWLTVFQRTGQVQDLRSALQWLEKAIELAPSDERLWAQVALVWRAFGDDQKAQEAWTRAEELSAAGGHADRSLDRVRVLGVRPLGEQLLRSGPLEMAALDAWQTME